MKSDAAVNTQMRYARVAGFVYLLLIVMYICGEIIISHIAGAGTLVDNIKRILAGERLYRVALSLEMLLPVCTVVLAYALFATLRSVNENLAKMAMFWRLGEAFIGGMSVIVDFTILKLYSDPSVLNALGADNLQVMIDLVRNAGFVSFSTCTTFFSVGSTLFFYLFFKSRCIPRLLSVFGLFASVVVLLTSLGNLVLPEYRNVIQFGWAPIFIAEITTGVWLLVRGVRTESEEKSVETDT